MDSFCRSSWTRSIITASASSSAASTEGSTLAPSASRPTGTSVGGPATTTRAPSVRQAVEIAPGDAAVKHVADDGDRLALQRPPALVEGEGVEQRLRGVGVCPVARVHHGAADLTTDEVRGSRGGVPEDDDVGPQGDSARSKR